MFSQLLRAGAAAIIIMSPFVSPYSWSWAEDQAPEVVKGTGIYRSADDCLKSIPPLGRKLGKAGLKLTKPIECQEVAGEPESFEPVFEATSALNIEVETAIGSYVENIDACQINLKAMLHIVADKSERIIDAQCIPVSISDFESGELKTGQFQPMVLLIKYK